MGSSNYMKTLTHILIIFVLFGCSQVERKNHNQTSNRASLLIDNKIVQNSIESIVHPIKLPYGFRLDTIQKNDKARNLSLFISLPVSNISQIDQIVFEEINNQKDDFIESLDEMIKNDNRILTSINSDFQAEPISVYKDTKVTSILFVITYYHGGAVHPITMYYSFNFDNITKQRIFFSDYFVIKNKVDTSYMTNQITKSIGREGVNVTDLNEIDFNIEQDTISFNFDDYEIASYAEGIIRGRIQKNKLNDKIKIIYR